MMWYPPLDWVNFPDTKLYTEEYGEIEIYLTILYNAVLVLGSNELGPVNQEEMLYFSIILLGGVILNVLIFGDIASIASSLGASDSQYQERMAEINNSMEMMQLDELAKENVRIFFKMT